MSSHTGRVYAITGGASGIGLETAKHLAVQGAAVSLADSNEAHLFNASDIIKQQTPHARVIIQTLDVRSRSDVAKWLERTVVELGDLDGAANMAGVINPSLMSKDLVEVPDEEWDFVIGVNLKGTMICLSEEIKLMKGVKPHGNNEGESRGSRSIVNAASVTGLVGGPRVSAYAASKHGIVGLTKSVSREVAKCDIRINAVAPGMILTPMITQGPDVRDASHPFANRTAMGRLGQPEEVARLISFLLSDEASYMTGGVYTVDGGFTS